jgi:tetratricopeptide (TPR) repeat protein
LRRAAAALILCIGVIVSCGREKVGFEELISRIDGELTLGALEQAAANIQQAIRVAAGRSEWFSLLKRAYILGSAAGTFDTLYTTSKAALSDISGAEEFAAICVFSCLRTGKYEMAFQLAEEYLSSDKWSPILNEAILRRHALDKGILSSSNDENLLLDAVFSENPAALARAADLFDESRFALAAALKFAADGEINTAADTLIPYADEHAEPALLLLYDAERYVKAAEVVFSAARGGALQVVKDELIKGDIFLRLKDTSAALALYKELIEKKPDISWIPYVNASLILSAQGDFQEAVTLINKGKETFPGVSQLLLSEILIYSGENEETAVTLIDEYRDAYPADLEISAIAATVLPSDANRIRLESAMWNIFLENPGYARYARYLAASLLSSGDDEGISMLLDVWERENGDTSWSLFLRGYQALINRAADAAAEAFGDSYLLSPRWETAFNLGVIARRTGDYELAIDYYRDAESLLPEKWHMITPTKAYIRAAIARTLYERGDFESALREARYGMDLDPGSNEAALLIDLLEQKRN